MDRLDKIILVLKELVNKVFFATTSGSLGEELKQMLDSIPSPNTAINFEEPCFIATCEGCNKEITDKDTWITYREDREIFIFHQACYNSQADKPNYKEYNDAMIDKHFADKEPIEPKEDIVEKAKELICDVLDASANSLFCEVAIISQRAIASLENRIKELEGKGIDNAFWKERYDENTEITNDIIKDRDKLLAENKRLTERIKELEVENKKLKEAIDILNRKG